MTEIPTFKTSWPEIYKQRRNQIRESISNGIILWMGHDLQPRNYTDNTYLFRQNSHFLYYAGLSQPDLAMISFPEADNDVLFAKPLDMDDIIWSGPGLSLSDLGRKAGIAKVERIERLEDYLTKARAQGVQIHYLAPCQHSLLMKMASLLSTGISEVAPGASQLLMENVALQRSIKSDAEIAEIEEALEITREMHRACMAVARAGKREYQIAGLIQAIALSHDRQQAFTPIVTVHGETLHNHSYGGMLTAGRLVLNDSGAESQMYYASDITRTCPVDGRFTSLQAEVYRIVLHMQLGAMERIKPGIAYRDVHLTACDILVNELISLGLMKGNATDAVEAGAHALFFPHGIGHMMGLDVHDMEDLGDVVGYGKKETRSNQFGLNFLRLSRPLEAGFVLTVEPGIYFIPALIDRWQGENLHKEFINYDRLSSFRHFGGIRIEDDVLVTQTGTRILGPAIPKTIEEVEEACASPDLWSIGSREQVSKTQKLYE